LNRQTWQSIEINTCMCAFIRACLQTDTNLVRNYDCGVHCPHIISARLHTILICPCQSWLIFDSTHQVMFCIVQTPTDLLSQPFE